MADLTPAPGSPSSPITVRWRWAEHVGTALTLGYLALIVIGMFHSWLRYFRFRINIFDYAEPTDFLLAPIRDTGVIAATVLPVGLSWLYLTYTDRWSRKHWIRRRSEGKSIGWWESRPETLAKYDRLKPILWPLMTMLWILAVGMWYAKRAADATMVGDGPSVEVELTNGSREGGTPRRPVMLVGASSKYLFLFRTEDWKTVVVPIENVSRLTPVERARGYVSVRPKMEQRMDSAAARAPGDGGQGTTMPKP